MLLFLRFTPAASAIQAAYRWHRARHGGWRHHDDSDVRAELASRLRQGGAKGRIAPLTGASGVASVGTVSAGANPDANVGDGKQLSRPSSRYTIDVCGTAAAIHDDSYPATQATHSRQGGWRPWLLWRRASTGQQPHTAAATAACNSHDSPPALTPQPSSAADVSSPAISANGDDLSATAADVLPRGDMSSPAHVSVKRDATANGNSHVTPSPQQQHHQQQGRRHRQPLSGPHPPNHIEIGRLEGQLWTRLSALRSLRRWVASHDPSDPNERQMRVLEWMEVHLDGVRGRVDDLARLWGIDDDAADDDDAAAEGQTGGAGNATGQNSKAALIGASSGASMIASRSVVGVAPSSVAGSSASDHRHHHQQQQRTCRGGSSTCDGEDDSRSCMSGNSDSRCSAHRNHSSSASIVNRRPLSVDEANTRSRELIARAKELAQGCQSRPALAPATSATIATSAGHGSASRSSASLTPKVLRRYTNGRPHPPSSAGSTASSEAASNISGTFGGGRGVVGDVTGLSDDAECILADGQCASSSPASRSDVAAGIKIGMPSRHSSSQQQQYIGCTDSSCDIVDSSVCLGSGSHISRARHFFPSDDAGDGRDRDGSSTHDHTCIDEDFPRHLHHHHQHHHHYQHRHRRHGSDHSGDPSDHSDLAAAVASLSLQLQLAMGALQVKGMVVGTGSLDIAPAGVVVVAAGELAQTAALRAAPAPGPTELQPQLAACSVAAATATAAAADAVSATITATAVRVPTRPVGPAPGAAQSTQTGRAGPEFAAHASVVKPHAPILDASPMSTNHGGSSAAALKQPLSPPAATTCTTTLPSAAAATAAPDMIATPPQGSNGPGRAGGGGGPSILSPTATSGNSSIGGNGGGGARRGSRSAAVQGLLARRL